MKKSKSMIENGNVYSGDDEGFESSPEKVCNKSQQKNDTRSLNSIVHTLCNRVSSFNPLLKPISRSTGAGVLRKKLR